MTRNDFDTSVYSNELNFNLLYASQSGDLRTPLQLNYLSADTDSDIVCGTCAVPSMYFVLMQKEHMAYYRIIYFMSCSEGN
jgi:hypothetical protein